MGHEEEHQRGEDGMNHCIHFIFWLLVVGLAVYRHTGLAPSHLLRYRGRKYPVMFAIGSEYESKFCSQLNVPSSSLLHFK